MLSRDSFTKFRQDRSVHVIQLIIAVAIFVDYSITNTISDFMGGWFYLLPILAITPSLFFPVGDYTTPRVRKLLLVLHHSIAATLLVVFTDIFGPYFQLLVLLLFTAAIWYGIRGVIYSLLASYATISLALWHQLEIYTRYVVYEAGLYALSLAILALLFERIVKHQRKHADTQDEANESLYFERTRLLSLINSMADAVIATDQKGTILLYNGAALELFDTNKSLHDESIQSLAEFKKSDGSTFNVVTEASKRSGTMVREDIGFEAADGSNVDLSISVSPVLTPGSTRNEAGYIMVLRDITKQKTLDEQKDEFISVASHELRTPIAIAEANISTAMLPKFSEELSEEGRKLLEQAHENVVFLSSLVSDLHVLAQAEKGHLEVDISEVDPKEFIEKMILDYETQVKEKGLKLKTKVADDLGAIHTSYDALREIMQNYITNSIKYTEKGYILLKAYRDDEGKGVVFAVEDSGIGISATDQKHVFEKFYRSEDYRTRQSGGTGLGLYITKRLLERMGGEVWFESKLNKGSTFYCLLPDRPKKKKSRKSARKD